MAIDARRTLEEAAERAGLSLKLLSEGLGKNHAYLQQFVKRGVPRRLPEEIRRALASQLDVSEADLGGPDGISSTLGSTQPIGKLRPAEELVGNSDLPVYAAARGGEGHLIVTFDAVEYVRRPQPLRHVKDGYGLLVTGESMIPAFRPADIALVNPRLPPERGEDVILYHNPPDGEAEATIKHLIGFNDQEWTLEQFNPADTFKLDRQEWPVCHRVVGKYSRR